MDHSHSDWREVVPHSGFDLHFSDNEWCWACFIFIVAIFFFQSSWTAGLCMLFLLMSFLTGPHTIWGVPERIQFRKCWVKSFNLKDQWIFPYSVDSLPLSWCFYFFIDSSLFAWNFFFTISIIATICGISRTCYTLYAAAAKPLQSCLTLCDPIDGSPPGSSVPGILQARTLEWVAISFSNAGKRKVKVKSLSRVRLFATPWTAAFQAPPSMGFSRQECWSGVPLLSLYTLHTFNKNKHTECPERWGLAL